MPPQNLPLDDQTYRILLEQGTAVAVLNVDGTVRYVSRTAARLTGRSVREVLGTPALSYLHPEDRPQTEALLAQLIQQPGRRLSTEFRLRHADGSWLWLEATGVSLLADPAIAAIAIYYRDVTQRRVVEQQLHLLATALEAAANAIVVTDPHGTIEWVNPAFTQLTGYTAAEAVGRNPRMLKSGAQDAAMYQTLWETILAGRPWSGELINRRKDRTTYIEEMTITPVRDADGTISHFIAVKQDVTERRRARQALQESENRYRTLFENSATSLWEEDFSILKRYLEEQRAAGVTDFRAFFADHPEALRHCADLVSVTDVNQATLKLMEVTDKAALLGPLSGIFGEESYPSFQEQLVALAEGELQVAGEIVHLTRTGRRIYVDLKLTVVAGYEETWAKVSVALTDLTARKLAEHALLASNRELAIRNRIISLSGSTLRTEEALESICREVQSHWRLAQVVAWLRDRGAAHATVLAEQRRPHCESLLAVTFPIPGGLLLSQPTEVLALRRPVHDAALAQLPAAIAPSWASTIVHVPLTVQGAVVGGIACYADDPAALPESELGILAVIGQTSSQIVENSLLYRELAEHNDHLETLVDERTRQVQQIYRQMAAVLNNTTEAILLVNGDGTIESANAAFAAQFGYGEAALKGAPLTLIAAAGSQDAVATALTAVQADQTPQRLEFSACRADGTTFDAEATLTSVPNNANHLVFTLHDISHLKTVERMKDRFIANVNHELRTPIAGIMLSAESLAAHYARLDDTTRLRHIGQIRSQSRVMTELIDAILDIARVDARANQPGRDLIDMRSLAANVVAELRSQAEAKRQHIDFVCAPSILPVRGEHGDYSRVWRNLIANAIKYTPEEGAIRVRLQSVAAPEGVDGLPLPADLPRGGYLVGQVIDNGHGIADEDLPNLFTRFYRGWAHYSNIPGTGLGLALVREVLRLYRGDVVVESKLNAGSTFTFWLPLGATEHSQ